MTDLLASHQFPRSAKYHPDWVRSGVSGGANPLWLTEWLTNVLSLRPGQRVLDLGCGRALSSIFLRHEFGVQVWAADVWFGPDENWQRVRDAGLSDGVFPLRADARTLPFPAEFFDAIVSIDSYPYFGTDANALGSLVRFLKPGGLFGLAGAGLAQEIPGDVPPHLAAWWDPSLWNLQTAAGMKRQFERTGCVVVEHADLMPDGCQRWLDWHHTICPDNHVEIQALTEDAGRYLGYVRVVARRRNDVTPPEPITSIPTTYQRQPVFRTGE